jgi:hypothetical protein
MMKSWKTLLLLDSKSSPLRVEIENSLPVYVGFGDGKTHQFAFQKRSPLSHAL